MLVDAIASAGGPTYAFFDVAPVDGTSGGVPGGNIRNAFLYNADRVKLVDFESLTPAMLTNLGVSDPNAFFGTRNPLMATFKFDGKEKFLIGPWEYNILDDTCRRKLEWLFDHTYFEHHTLEDEKI